MGFASLVFLACSKPSPSEQSSAATSSSAGAKSGPPVGAASASAAAGAAVAAPAGSAAMFAGSYVAKQGPVEPPAAAKEKTWTDDPGTDAVGKGTMELSVDGSPSAANAPPRKVVGEAKGPLGTLSIAGTFDGHEVRANVIPKEANAPGAMTGFMTLTAEGPTSLKGTLRVANGNARIVREAAVELARK
jgi:hypothetical protein